MSLQFHTLTIFILNDFIVERLGHGNSTAWEVGVVIQFLPQRNAGRGITVTSQQSKQVVLATESESKNVDTWVVCLFVSLLYV